MVNIPKQLKRRRGTRGIQLRKDSSFHVGWLLGSYREILFLIGLHCQHCNISFRMLCSLQSRHPFWHLVCPIVMGVLVTNKLCTQHSWITGLPRTKIFFKPLTLALLKETWLSSLVNLLKLSGVPHPAFGKLFFIYVLYIITLCAGIIYIVLHKNNWLLMSDRIIGTTLVIQLFLCIIITSFSTSDRI